MECFLTRNRCYQAAQQNTKGGLMLHSVGCPQPSAQVFVNSWNSADKSVCVHAFIDANTGNVYQTLPWEYRGWHCGSGPNGSGNNTHIGVEMCEPSCIKYTSGARFTCSNVEEAQAAVRRTYESAVQLFAELCERFNLDPLADSVILSHEEGHKRGIANNHGDPVHLWNQLNLGYTMDGFRKAVKAVMGSPAISSNTRIVGTAQATADQMRAYVKAKNPSVAQSVIDMIPLYLSEGAAEGIRGDLAFAQSCLETGNFTFSGSAVTLDQNNFCGMGVTANGMIGNFFDTPQFGIRAQVQHLKAYASTDALTNACIDPRFKYVSRGSAEFVEWLGIQENPHGKGWAAGARYGEKILNILNKITGTEADPEAPAKFPYKVRVKIPDLHIRKGAGTNYQKDGFTGQGVFTVVDEADGQISSTGKIGKWGLLKSGEKECNRWICLSLGASVTEKL